MLKPATFTLLAMGSCVIALLFFDFRALMYFRASVQSWLEGLWWLIAEMVFFANRMLYRIEDFLAELSDWSRNEMRWYIRELNRGRIERREEIVGSLSSTLGASRIEGRTSRAR